LEDEMETITSIGYLITGITVVLSIAAYFILPGLIKKAFESDDDKPEE
jgi:hypothetical protein